MFFRYYAIIISLFSTQLFANPPQPGDVVGDCTFKDTRYLNRSLADFKDAKAIVVVFLDTGCPIVPRYLPTLKKMEQEYRTKGVHFLGLFPGADDSVIGLAAFALKHDIEFPCGKDYDGACAKKLGVTRTPEAVVLDGNKKLRYRGRIDDQYKPGGARPEPTSRDLLDAIETVVNGRNVTTATTPVDGCPITFVEPRPAETKCNFAEHIAPILKKHCQECHRPNTVAPFSLIDYQQVSSRARTIFEVVRDGSMPPWYGAPEHGEFANRRGLSSEEKEMLLSWLGSSRPAGDLSKLPATPPVANDWRIGKPDLIVTAPQHDIPEAGDIPYKYAFLPHLFLNDTWVDSVEIKPDNPKVLHHCNMAYAKLSEQFSVQNFITGAVPGGEAMTLPKGVAVKIPAGSFLVLQIHYISTGQPEKCKISVGFRYAREEVQQRLRLSYVATTRYSIPPLVPAHKVSATRTLPCDAIGVGMFSHMHVRGKDMTFLAHKPDGTTENLLTIPNFNFGWQHAYRWDFGKKTLPKGTRLECIAHYDNSPFNPYNPDPKATVRDGQQTHEEMLNGFVFYVDANEKLGLKIDLKTGKPIE